MLAPWPQERSKWEDELRQSGQAAAEHLRVSLEQHVLTWRAEQLVRQECKQCHALFPVGCFAMDVELSAAHAGLRGGAAGESTSLISNHRCDGVTV